MSFSGRTPEALLPRSDSKNPATTCKGITSTGRPCRRALAANSNKSSPASSPSRGVGILAVLDQQNAATFYCWQHKDQAEQLAARADQKTRLRPLREKSSIDTLVEQVGILNLDEDVPEQPKRHRRRQGTDGHGTRRRETLPSGWNQMESPLMTVPEELSRPPQHRSPSPRSNVKFSWACCVQADDDDLPPPRLRREHERFPSRLEPVNTVPRYTSPMQMTSAWPEMMQSPAPSYQPRTPGRGSNSPAGSRPKPSPTPSNKSQTQTFLSLIPSHLSPQTTSQLLTELSRPISAADDAGYIYIFWLTPESETSKPDDETASSLLDDEDGDDLQYTSPRSQRTNQALTRYASVRHPPNGNRNRNRNQNQATTQRTITLKIGRAANVHRRMTQWTKQCGQNISLIRYYPYTSTNTNTASTSSSSSVSSRWNSNVPISGKVPHVNRVERLIHLELAERRIVKSECEQCGREHREWFEIEATRAGLRAVDEVIRRWVGWAQRQ